MFSPLSGRGRRDANGEGGSGRCKKGEQDESMAKREGGKKGMKEVMYSSVTQFPTALDFQPAKP